MKLKGLVGLLLATAVAVIVAVLVSTGGPHAENPQIGKAVLPGVGPKLGEVARVTLVHGAEKTTLQRQGKSYVVAEKGDYPADAAKLHQTLLGLAELDYVEPKTSKPDLYPRLEVEDPGKTGAKSTLVTVSDGKGTLIGELIIGKRRIDELGGGNDGIYVRKPGNAQSWLARGTLDISGDTTSWLDRNVVDLPRDKVKEVVLIQPDGSKLDIAHDKPGAPLALKDQPANTKLKSDTVLVEPTTALASLTLTDVKPAADLPFPAEGVSRAEFTSFDGLTLKLALFDKDGKSWLHIEASGTGPAEKQAADINARVGKWVYAIPDYKAKALRTKLVDVTEPAKSS